MSPSFKDVLRENYTYLIDHLDARGLTPHLFEKKVLTQDEMEEILGAPLRNEQAKMVIDLMRRKTENDFSIFLHVLKKLKQKFVADILEKALQSPDSEGMQVDAGQRSATPGEEEMEEGGNDDTEIKHARGDGAAGGGDDDDDDEEEDDGDDEDEDDDDMSENKQDIKEFRYSRIKKRVTFCGNVISGHTPAKNGVLVEIADNTGAVDCWVHESMSSAFQIDAQLMLTRVKWTGQVINVNKKSQVTETFNNFGDTNEVKAMAFGLGEPTRIDSVKDELPINSWFCVSGRVVKVSNLERKVLYGGNKILTHRLVRLNDGSGSLNLSVWEDIAPRIQRGELLHITSCKKKLEDDRDVLVYTTTRKSIKKSTSKMFPGVKESRGMTTGCLKAISLDTFQSCLNSECYHFPLDESGNCESCGDAYAVANHDYAKGIVKIESKKKVKSFDIFWPELQELFKLFRIDASISDGEESLKKKFISLVKSKTSIKYFGYGNLQRFKTV